jgi:hypothetical protein
MPHFKESKKFIHEPSTKEIFNCIANEINWANPLVDNSNKPYSKFLQFIIQKIFYKDLEDRITKHHNENTNSIHIVFMGF